jgi:hypothetical protein
LAFPNLFEQIWNPKIKIVPHKVDKGSEHKGKENPKISFRQFLFVYVRFIQSHNATDKRVHNTKKIDKEKCNIGHS